MSLDYRIQPIGAWPGARTPYYSRVRSQFKTIEGKVLGHVQRELRHLGGKQIVFRLEVTERDIRLDGMLRANARPSDPGVILEFTASRLKGTPRLLYRCDRFKQWWDNLSAIARALEALRMVDRYGVTPTGEQYAGFKALPSQTAPTLTTEQAAMVVGAASGVVKDSITGDRAIAKEAVRIAKARTHPDRHDGDRTKWDRVESAASVLSSHHGVSL